MCEVITAVLLEMQVFSDVTLCRLLSIFRRFERMKSLWSFETKGIAQKTKQSNTREDFNF
jgi:transcriptional regulator NrdR family protein